MHHIEVPVGAAGPGKNVGAHNQRTACVRGDVDSNIPRNRSGPRWVKAPAVLALRAAGGVGLRNLMRRSASRDGGTWR